MSMKSGKFERSTRPAILSRKRKAEKEFVVSPSPEFSSPSSSSTHISSLENTPSSDTDSADENHPPKVTSDALTHFRGVAHLMGRFSTCQRSCPLPDLDWAEQKELWHSMVLKDMVYVRDSKMLLKHPDLDARMRAILLDWLTEVCEVYRLHRETFHLAVDYVDRFLMAKPNLPRNCLQLLGATALFVASKMEEIYPPKLEQFAFVTDGACQENDIIAQELVLIMSLNWNLTPITINCWLSIFLQLAYLENAENLVGPETFPKSLFLQLSLVLDLCVIDVESLKYSYSLLVASAIANFMSKETAMHVSGLSWSELCPCVKFMEPFVAVVIENGPVDLKYFSDVPMDDCHNIQTHSSSLQLMELVVEKQRKTSMEFSPSTVLRELTPPQSHKKKQMRMEA